MRHRRVLPSFVSFLLLVLMVATGPFPAGAGVPTRKAHAYRASLDKMNARLRTSVDRAARATAAPLVPITNNFTVIGHTDLGASDTNGDVWVHGNFAYVGTWGDPCNGLGVKIVDVTNPANPVMLPTRVGGIAGTSAEDVVVRSVSTASFTGDLLAVGIQRCDFQDASLDNAEFGVDFWNVTNPAAPVHLSFLGVTTGDGGVHELDLFQRGTNVYALLAAPFSEWFDPMPGGDFSIADVTNPASPTVVGEWGAGAHGLSRGPFYGQGSFGSMYDHSARASADGTKAYVSYWDLGVVTLDISNVANPTLVSRTTYEADADGDAHSLAVYPGTSRTFLLQNDEDFDPRSPAHIVSGGDVGIGSEAPYARPLWRSPEHRLTGRVVRPAREGCSPGDYGSARTQGRIAVVKTYFKFFDPQPHRPACRPGRQEKVAQGLGAAAVVHDFIARNTSPQWVSFTSGIRIPVLFTDHATALGMVDAGRARLVAQQPSWGFLRVFDASTGQQVANFDDLPYVHTLTSPLGAWSIHNNEVMGNRSYASWYTHGIVALDLTPLNAATPGDPVMVGQFVPDAGVSHSDFIPNVPIVWGVAIRASDGLIFVSDMNSGLWIVDP
ncbi:MAG TPA: hypothetical protein VGA93_03785, partial [Actinomycetota bacterium]